MGTYVDRIWEGNPGALTRAERSRCRYRAYIPDPLSGISMQLSAQTAADLVDVEQQVRTLNDEHPALANLEPLARFLLRAEAVASSNIEGLVLNVRRLARTEAAQREGVEVTDHTARAVLGNVDALDAALRAVSNPAAPVTVAHILSIHSALLRGTRDERWAGVVRTEQNWVGGLTPCHAAFVPPPAENVPELLSDLANYISDDSHPALLQAALVHAQFETIHPFADGNGRTGRALIQLVMRRRGIAPTVLPPVSLVLAAGAKHYISALESTRAQGGDDPWAKWIDHFLAATARACADGGRFAVALADLDEKWREKCGPMRADSAAHRVISSLPTIPVFTASTMATHIGRSYQATSEALRRLETAGVVREMTLGRRNRAFEAVGLFEAFTGFERSLASPAGDTLIEAPARPVPARAPRPRS